MKIQLNTVLFAKTLVRKDVASSAATPTDSSTDGKDTSSTSSKKTEPTVDAGKVSTSTTDGAASVTTEASTGNGSNSAENAEEAEFSSKAQIMTLMTTDVDRVSEFAWHCFALFGGSRTSEGLVLLLTSVFIEDSPIELFIGTVFLYSLLGSSAFFGLATALILLPLNQFASKFVVIAQDNLMKARDERVALMNEVLGAIRMLKVSSVRNSTVKILNIHPYQ